jgi:hypothetical protein
MMLRLSRDEWHPLDGPAPEEYIPEQWIGPHVGLRLVESFKTLAQLPSGFRGFVSGIWPEYYYDRADLNSQQQADNATKEDDANERNRARIRPSAQEISRMEAAISWPGRYIAEPEISRVVQHVALARSRELDMRYVARKLRMGERRVRDWNEAGLAAIARGLRVDEVRVF